MSRSVAWRRTVSDVVNWRQDQALNATIYILRETGPTGFLLKEDSEQRKYKVFLGDPHSCTCSDFKKDKDLCKHICWLLLKKFRVPRQNDMSWQLGLVEREINGLLRGLIIKKPPAHQVHKQIEEASEGRAILEQRPISDDDVCPICQDELLEKHLPVTYCKFGCGNSIHIKCMKVWADHQKISGETTIKCPFCREDFGPFDLLKQEARNSNSGSGSGDRMDRHLGVMCRGCHVCPIEGKCYRCSVCMDYHLCKSCFNTPVHIDHTFQFRQKRTQRWRPAPRVLGSALPHAITDDIMNREISDSDYDVLLQLDRPIDHEDIPERVINAFPLEKVRSGSLMLAPGMQCRVCLRSYQLGQPIRRLPCKHKFHQDCIDNWLRHSRPSCPVDGQLVWSNHSLDEENDERLAQRRLSRTRSEPSTTENSENGLVLEIPGVGIVNQFRGRSSEQIRSGRRDPQLMNHVDAVGVPQMASFQLNGTSLHNETDNLSNGLIMNASARTHLSPSLAGLRRHTIGRHLTNLLPEREPVAPSIPIPHNRVALGFERIGSAPNLVDGKPPTSQESQRSRSLQRRNSHNPPRLLGRSNSRERQRSTSRERVPANIMGLYLGNDPQTSPTVLISEVTQRPPVRRFNNAAVRRGVRRHNMHVPSSDIHLEGSAFGQLTLRDILN